MRGRGFQSWRFLLGPEQIMLAPGRRVSSATEYLAWHLDAITQRGGQPWDSPEAAPARVNHGRWIADCFWCHAAMLTRPEWRVAYCAECGARYGEATLVFPDGWRDIEATLVQRISREQQNWDARQTAKELAEENRLPEVMTA